MLYRDGQRHDLLFMGILRPEWEKQQADGENKPGHSSA